MSVYRMRLKGLTAALIGLSVLCWTGCASSRKATSSHSEQVSSFRFQDSRDSLRDEISQNLNENLTEHEVVTETVIVNDTLKIERISDRQRTLVSGSQMQDTKVVVRTETVRDTVYIERVDTVQVQEVKLHGTSGSLRSALPLGSAKNYLKWICWIIIGLIGLIVTVKICHRR